uniref:Uncharacterized protein n=1 Tax=Schistocephalus solidus TaxID=70667 RepID=A0A0X3PLF0_SCHSO
MTFNNFLNRVFACNTQQSNQSPPLRLILHVKPETISFLRLLLEEFPAHFLARPFTMRTLECAVSLKVHRSEYFYGHSQEWAEWTFSQSYAWRIAAVWVGTHIERPYGVPTCKGTSVLRLALFFEECILY